MRVFVAGATGVIGRRLLPLLTSSGHEVIGLARSYGAAVEVEMLDAAVAEADALDSGALRHLPPATVAPRTTSGVATRRRSAPSRTAF
jgi:uncharacterized protein YbjT (DUF2867 family)